MGEWLEHWSAATPEAVALVKPDGAGGWHTLSCGLRGCVGAVGQALLDL